MTAMPMFAMSVLLAFLWRENASIRVYDGLTWPDIGYASIDYPQCRRATFFPWASPIPREARKLPGGILRCASVLKDAASIVSGPSVAIETAMVAARPQRARRIDMANIGTFTKTEQGFTGEIVTLSLKAKNVRLVEETAGSNDNAPTHRVFVGRVEIGAAWAKRSNEGRAYLSVKLDDPSFTGPIYANLIEDEGGKSHTLIWSRARRATAD
jgi:uncharacterized protein (DUF736 family)